MSQFIILLSWNSTSLALSIQIWFREKIREPSDGNQNIRPHQDHPIIYWKLPLLDNDCKRGRQAANKTPNPIVVAMHGVAQDIQIQIEASRYIFKHCNPFNCWVATSQAAVGDKKIKYLVELIISDNNKISHIIDLGAHKGKSAEDVEKTPKITK